MGLKYTIEDMRELARKRGGKCLSKQYHGALKHHKWQCECGYKWETAPSSIYNLGSWCPKCSGNLKLTIQDMQAIAKTCGGKCLSKSCTSGKEKLEWQCSEGHKWWSTGSSIKNVGTWCPTCSRVKTGVNRRLGIDYLHSLAKSFGGKCLSKTYDSVYTKYLWECKKGHQWRARIGDMKRKKICCPECRPHRRESMPTRLTIEEMRKIAKSRGGKCLSKKYVNGRTLLKWECEVGHKWEATPGNIKSGKWCRKCGHAKSSIDRSLGIDAMHKLASSNGGKCLSEVYVNSHTKLKWECANGHVWEAVPSPMIHKGVWCPNCSSGISERICRAYFSQIFGKPFPRLRPLWLRNKNGNLMELDGYCEDLKLAFEHQGEQHYTTNTHFVNSKELLKRKKDDKEKVRLCQQNRVRLIAIPELFSRTKLEDLQQFIYDECKRLQVFRPSGMLGRKINLKNAYASKHSENMLEELRAIAKGKKGKVISKEYVNSKFHLAFECSHGHQWTASPYNIKSGKWCPECAGNTKNTIEEMHSIANSREGKCLSRQYVNFTTRLKWECSEGHQFMATPKNVKSAGSWCPTCSVEKNTGKQRLSIEAMHKLAKTHGGKCLSKVYVNNRTKLEWECVEGHRWMLSPGKVKYHGQWCPKCKKK